MKKYLAGKRNRRIYLLYMLAIAGVLSLVHSCNKSGQAPAVTAEANALGPIATTGAAPFQQGALQKKVVSVFDINTKPDGSTRVLFRELAEAFTTTDGAMIAALKSARMSNEPVKIAFDPWKGQLSQVTTVTPAERAAHHARPVVVSPGIFQAVDLDNTNPDVINTIGAEGVMNTTTPGLTAVIPDMATAQLMFDYITHQCCALPGPYTIDYCITFQYCEDGCYARAHKMCYIINNKYHYATHKIFSFAYPDAPYTLSVQAQKWGGCCINWWFHVAPLVSIKTPTGTEAYVMDPAMFDQPVLLATWLHAQQNPACAGGDIPKVTSFNIQPTSSYAPYTFGDTSTFVTDPFYADTDTTLVNYQTLLTCP